MNDTINQSQDSSNDHSQDSSQDLETPTPSKSAKASSKSLPKAPKDAGYKVIFEGAAAEKLLWFEGQLRERCSKPDMGMILGKELLNFDDSKWSALIEENTEMDYFFSQIRKIKDKPKVLKLLKGLSEKLIKENESKENESSDEASSLVSDTVLLAQSKPSRKKSMKMEAASVSAD